MSRDHQNAIALNGLDEQEAINIRDDLSEVTFDFDPQHYTYENENDFDRDFILIDDYEADHKIESQADRADASLLPLPQRIELERIELKCGLIEPGDVVELNDPLGYRHGHLPRGDFLLVTSIKADHQTGEAFLCGYTLRRTTHIAPTFNRHINDLFLFLHTRDDDSRSPFVQGAVEKPVGEVLRKRLCEFTHLNEKARCMSDVNLLPQRLTEPTEKFKWVFEKGVLICRYVYVIGLYGKTGKSYKGEARYMYQRECREFAGLKNSASDFVRLADEDLSFVARNPFATSYTSKRNRAQSVEEIQGIPVRQQPRHPQKTRRFTFNDFFCGIGGVSDGARQAGFRVNLGLDNEEVHMAGYAENHPGAQHLCMSAHDFPEIAKRGINDANHCHFSCPCKFWSIAHVVDGKDDEKNMMTIFTPGPILEKLKPSTISFEQTPGLLIIKKHALYFRNLINQCLNAGYNLRWEVQDMAWFGLPQHRPRLIMLGAKKGIPIPPLAKPTHGPAGSGLQSYVTVYEAFRSIRQRGELGHDPHHLPYQETHFDPPKDSYDPKKMLAATLTTSGGDQAHYSGLRQHTVREMSLLQGFDIGYIFPGTKRQSREAIGNAWGPLVSRPQLLSCAATKEAFDQGWISAEDHVDDLYELLESKGLGFPNNEASQYRYISRLKKSIKPNSPLIIFGRRKQQQASPPEENQDDDYSYDFFDAPPRPVRNGQNGSGSQGRQRSRTERDRRQFEEDLENAFINDAYMILD